MERAELGQNRGPFQGCIPRIDDSLFRVGEPNFRALVSKGAN